MQKGNLQLSDDRKTILIAQEMAKFLAQNRERIIKRALKRLRAEEKEAARNAKKTR